MYSLNCDYPVVLLTEREAPCLSLYQPTHRQHPDNAHDPLRERVWQVVQPHYLRRLAGLVESFSTAAANGRAVDGLHAIAEAAVAGRMPTNTGVAAIYRF